MVDMLATGDEAETSNCVETDSDGLYSISAVIGTHVKIEISYHNHSFTALDADHQSEYDAGYVIDGEGSYMNKNYKDVTTAYLHVQVAGGLCDYLLGTATLKFMINGCDWYREEEQVRSKLC